MYFKTADECGELARFFGFSADPQANKLGKITQVTEQLKVDFQAKQQNLLALARRIVVWLDGGRQLLWITERGVWPSSENWHLYYRLRGSYHDYKSIVDAPGHFFEDYERPDLVSFLELTLRFGWGGFLFGSSDYHITISHDEWMLIGCESSSHAIAKDLDDLKVPYQRTKA
jgi:hypothetical protein